MRRIFWQLKQMHQQQQQQQLQVEINRFEEEL